jgi:hypothetical protein
LKDVAQRFVIDLRKSRLESVCYPISVPRDIGAYLQI